MHSWWQCFRERSLRPCRTTEYGTWGKWNSCKKKTSILICPGSAFVSVNCKHLLWTAPQCAWLHIYGIIRFCLRMLFSSIKIHCWNCSSNNRNSHLIWVNNLWESVRHPISCSHNSGRNCRIIIIFYGVGSLPVLTPLILVYLFCAFHWSSERSQPYVVTAPASAPVRISRQRPWRYIVGHLWSRDPHYKCFL